MVTPGLWVWDEVWLFVCNAFGWARKERAKQKEGMWRRLLGAKRGLPVPCSFPTYAVTPSLCLAFPHICISSTFFACPHLWPGSY